MPTYIPLLPTPIQFQDTITSANMSGGKLEFYLAGTTTPTNLFSDSSGTSIGSSITLNSGGLPESGGNVITLFRDVDVDLKLVWKNALGSEIATSDNLKSPANWLTQAQLAQILLPQTSNELAASVTPTDYHHRGMAINALRYANLAEAISVAEQSGGMLYAPAGTYNVQGLSTTDDSKVTIFGDGPATILKKNANGEIINLGKQCTLMNLALDGNGANYTGVNVLINTGALDNFSWRRIINVDSYESASYAIEFTGNRAGYASLIDDCRLVPRTSSYTAAIKMANNSGSTENNGNRMIRNCWSFSQPIADLTDATNTDIVGCHGDMPIFTATTTKTNITGGRMNLGPTDWTLYGTANTISGVTVNSDGGNVIFDSGCANCRWDSSIALGSGITVTDNSDGANSGNEMYFTSQVYTPTWTGNSPAIGNGTLNGQYIRKGQKCSVNIQLVAGSTTTFGSGAWSFSLPYTAASRRQVGSAHVDDGGTTIYTGTALIEIGGATTVKAITNGSTSAFVGSASPHAWANGDKLIIDIEYLIA